LSLNIVKSNVSVSFNSTKFLFSNYFLCQIFEWYWSLFVHFFGKLLKLENILIQKPRKYLIKNDFITCQNKNSICYTLFLLGDDLKDNKEWIWVRMKDKVMYSF